MQLIPRVVFITTYRKKATQIPCPSQFSEHLLYFYSLHTADFVHNDWQSDSATSAETSGAAQQAAFEASPKR